MKRIAGVLLALTVCTCSAFGAGAGPQIQIIDNKVSIQADAIPLARLLHLLDRATGMTSKVPADLANRNISVRFSGLSFDDAIKKIFEGQPFDYVLLSGQGIVVTSLSQTVSTDTSAPPPLAANDVNLNPPENFNSPFNAQPQMPGVANGVGGAGVPGATPGVPGAPGVNNAANPAANRPTVIQTPMGPLQVPNTGAAQPASPMVAPGQQPAPNGNLSVPIPTFGSSPTTTPAPNPFGVPSTSPSTLGQRPIP